MNSCLCSSASPDPDHVHVSGRGAFQQPSPTLVGNPKKKKKSGTERKLSFFERTSTEQNTHKKTREKKVQIVTHRKI